MSTRAVCAATSAMLAACAAPSSEPVVIDLRGDPDAEVTRTFAVDGERAIEIVGADGHLVEAWVDGGTLADDDRTWLAPRPIGGALAVAADGDVTLTVWARGPVLPSVVRGRSLAWLDGALLDDPSFLSFARVLGAIANDGHGGRLLERWFRAFAAGPGAGRATFAQFLDDVAAEQGGDPAAWDLDALPFKVTGVHNRIDLATAEHCGELRVSVASTHPTFSPVHLIVLFRQLPGDDDVTPDGAVHCRGTARGWARLSALDDDAFRIAARAMLDATLVRERFLLAESVELSLSPWQWRQWVPAGDELVNPPLFQTVDVARVDTPGPLRDAFLDAVRANVDAIAARTWTVPPMFRSAVAEVQPNAKAPLIDLAGVAPAELSRALGMIGCPRCHTDDADFIHTGIDRTPSPFYDRELDARAARLDALGRGEHPTPPPFGPLQAL